MKILHILVGFYMMFAGSLFSNDIPESDSAFTVTIEATYSFPTAYGDGAMSSYGDYVYLANANSFEIVNVSNPSTPILESRYSFLNSATTYFIVIKEDYIYISRSGDKLAILDISNKKSPILIGEYDEKSGYIGINGQYLTASSLSGVRIMDISDKTNPRLVSSVLAGVAVGQSVIVGNYLYVVSTNYSKDALIIFDISDISKPVEVSRSIAYIGDGHGLHIEGNYAYVGDDNRFTIFDITNKTNIIHLSTKNYGHVGQIDIRGKYAFFNDSIRSTRGFHVANVADKENPYIVKSVTSLGVTGMISVNHNYAYALNTTSTLSIIKLWDLQPPSVIQRTEIRNNTDLRSLAQDNNMLNDLLASYNVIDIYLKNGAWTGTIMLPTNNVKENDKIIVHRRAGWGTTVHLNKYKQASVPFGASTFIYSGGVWTTDLNVKAQIRNNSILRSLANKDNVLKDMFLHNKEVYIYLKNGAWTGTIMLPTDNLKENDKVIVHRKAGWGTTVHLNKYKQASVPFGTSTFIYSGGMWTTDLNVKAQIRNNSILRSLANKDNILEDMFLHNRKIYIYLKNGAWTGTIMLPQNNITNLSEVIINRRSSWGSKVYFNDASFENLPMGDTTFIYANNAWHNKSTYVEPSEPSEYDGYMDYSTLLNSNDISPYGGSSSAPNLASFAALKSDGSIFAWGADPRGGSGAPTDSGYTKIYSSKFSFAAIKSDGSISAWGLNYGGSDAPTDSGYTKIYSNPHSFAAIKSDGSIFSWGNDQYGGSGAPTDSGYTKIYSNPHSFAAIKSDGSIFSWGNDQYGGSGAPTDSGYTKIYSATYSFAAIKSDGSIFAWGHDQYGGSGAPTDSGYTKIYSNPHSFAAIKSDGSIFSWGRDGLGGSGAPKDSGYIKIYSTIGAFAAIKSDGSIFAWGRDDFGGSGAPTDSGYIEIVPSSSAFAAIKSDGSISAWGQYGVSDAPTDSGYTKIYSNNGAFAAIKSDGSISAWGLDGFGVSDAPTDSGYTKIYSSIFAFAAIKSDGSIYSWGSWGSWEYEDGNTSDAPTDSGYTKIYSSRNAFAAIKSDGSISAWGADSSGGSGAPTDSGYTEIYSTIDAFAAIKSDGSIFAWGSDDDGGLGAPADNGYFFNLP